MIASQGNCGTAWPGCGMIARVGCWPVGAALRASWLVYLEGGAEGDFYSQWWLLRTEDYGEKVIIERLH